MIHNTTIDFEGARFEVVASVYLPTKLTEDDLPEVTITAINVVDATGLDMDEVEAIMNSDMFDTFAKAEIIEELY